MVLTVVIYCGIVNACLLINFLFFFSLMANTYDSTPLCSVPYGLSWGWVDWLVLGVCLVGFNIKFVLSLCSGTKNTPLCS